jgi:hypothetical protein
MNQKYLVSYKGERHNQVMETNDTNIKVTPIKTIAINSREELEALFAKIEAGIDPFAEPEVIA